MQEQILARILVRLTLSLLGITREAKRFNGSENYYDEIWRLPTLSLSPFLPPPSISFFLTEWNVNLHQKHKLPPSLLDRVVCDYRIGFVHSLKSSTTLSLLFIPRNQPAWFSSDKFHEGTFHSEKNSIFHIAQDSAIFLSSPYVLFAS